MKRTPRAVRSQKSPERKLGERPGSGTPKPEVSLQAKIASPVLAPGALSRRPQPSPQLEVRSITR